MRKLALIAVLVVATGCGSFVRDSYRGLASFRAVYKTEEAVRETFCKDKTPQPEACVKAYNTALVGYTAWDQAVDLLAIYIDVKSQPLKAQIALLVFQAMQAAVELEGLKEQLK